MGVCLAESHVLRRHSQERWRCLAVKVGVDGPSQIDERVRPRWTQVANAVQMRSHQRRPASPRVPCVILRSMITGRNFCSMPLLVGSTPDPSHKVK